MSNTVKLHVKAYITLRGFRWRKGSQLTALASFDNSPTQYLLRILMCLGRFKRDHAFALFRSGSRVNKIKQIFFRTKNASAHIRGKMRFVI